MADYTAIINKIDEAIENWVGEPVMLSEQGSSVTYRSLTQLIETRKYYATLQLQINNKKPFRITHLKAGGAR
ncbi:MAG: hypothetical protein PHY02_06385 [Phycisphaerae bacterium]|nr:hypothetical protein [Phycisphaerae bacterium]